MLDMSVYPLIKPIFPDQPGQSDLPVRHRSDHRDQAAVRRQPQVPGHHPLQRELLQGGPHQPQEDQLPPGPRWRGEAQLHHNQESAGEEQNFHLLNLNTENWSTQ